MDLAARVFDLGVAINRQKAVDLHQQQERRELVERVKERLVEALTVGESYREVAAHAIVFDVLGLDTAIEHIEERIGVLQALWADRPDYPFDLERSAEVMIAATYAVTRKRM